MYKGTTLTGMDFEKYDAWVARVEAVRNASNGGGQLQRECVLLRLLRADWTWHSLPREQQQRWAELDCDAHLTHT